MITRRNFLGTLGAGAVGAGLAETIALDAQPASAADADSGQRKRLAIVTTEWRYHSHAWHMGERFLVGYPIGGRWHHPPLDVVACYVDQQPEGDLSRQRSARVRLSDLSDDRRNAARAAATSWRSMPCW